MSALRLMRSVARAEPVPCSESSVQGCVETPQTVQVDPDLVAEGEPVETIPVLMVPAPAAAEPVELTARQWLYHSIVDTFIFIASAVFPAAHAYEGALLLIDKLLEALAAAATGLLVYRGLAKRRGSKTVSDDAAALKRALHREQLLQEQVGRLRAQDAKRAALQVSLLQEVQASRAAALHTAGHEV